MRVGTAKATRAAGAPKEDDDDDDDDEEINVVKNPHHYPPRHWVQNNLDSCVVSTGPIHHHHRHRRDDNLVCGFSPCPNPIRLEFDAFGLELFGIVLGDIIGNAGFIIILSGEIASC